MGFLSGLILGPPGIILALLLVKISGPRAVADDNQAAQAPVRLSYKVPLVGRLHVTTVWALAGLAAFVCAWGAGGLGFEMLNPSLDNEAASERADVAGVAAVGEIGRQPAPVTGGETLPEQAQRLQSNLGRTQLPQATFFDGLPNQQRQTRTAPAAGDHATRTVEAIAQATPSGTLLSDRETAAPQNPPAPEPTRIAPPPMATQQQQPQQQPVVAEVLRLFGSNGHRVHASLSGTGRTTTLSISGPTLTRAAGSQLLGNGRARESLKSSGVRIVVLVNGAESWTFLL